MGTDWNTLHEQTKWPITLSLGRGVWKLRSGRARGIYWKELSFSGLIPTTFTANPKWSIWPGAFDMLQKAFKIVGEPPTRWNRGVGPVEMCLVPRGKRGEKGGKKENANGYISKTQNSIRGRRNKNPACLLIISITRKPTHLRKLRQNYKSLSRGRCIIIFSSSGFH